MAEEIRGDAPSHAGEPKHLWEVDHPYYCSESNYFSNDCHTPYGTFPEFAEAAGDADLDMNLVFRWDWHEGEMGGSEFTGDPYYRNGLLQLFYVGQRKGLFRCVEVSVCRADEPAVIAFLRPRLAHLLLLWEPLSAEASVDGSSPQNNGAA